MFLRPRFLTAGGPFPPLRPLRPSRYREEIKGRSLEACAKCPASRYANYTGSDEATDCLRCPAGRFTEEEGAVRATNPTPSSRPPTSQPASLPAASLFAPPLCSFGRHERCSAPTLVPLLLANAPDARRRRRRFFARLATAPGSVPLHNAVVVRRLQSLPAQRHLRGLQRRHSGVRRAGSARNVRAVAPTHPNPLLRL